MPNKNYVKGRKKEYKVCKELRDEGFDIVVRSAGSHSPIDVWAVHKENKTMLLVQVKPDNYQHTIRLIKQMEWLNDNYKVRFCLR